MVQFKREWSSDPAARRISPSYLELEIQNDYILIEVIKEVDVAAETKVLTAHVPISLVEKVEAMASRLERSRGWVMKQALAAWVDQEEERQRMTLEALDDVKAGSVIDHQVVQAWANSLSTDKPLPPPTV